MARITKKEIDGAIAGLNKHCQRVGLPADYRAERSYGGYKLVQGAGERDIWHDRSTAGEFYARVWAYRAGLEAAEAITLERADLELCEGVCAELLTIYGQQKRGQGQTAGDKLDRICMSYVQSLKVKLARLLERVSS